MLFTCSIFILKMFCKYSVCLVYFCISSVTCRTFQTGLCISCCASYKRASHRGHSAYLGNHELLKIPIKLCSRSAWSSKAKHPSDIHKIPLTLPLQALHAGAINDYQKELQLRQLNAAKDAVDVKVLRSGNETLIPCTEILVGDVLLLDKISADGISFHEYALLSC